MDNEKLYSEAGEAWRHLTSWREKIVAGYLTVLAGLGVAFGWAPNPSFRSAILSGGIVVSLVFWVLDFRNRRLVGGCQVVLARLEDSNGCYAEIQRLRGEWTVLTHGSAVNLLVAAVIGPSIGGLMIYVPQLLGGAFNFWPVIGAFAVFALSVYLFDWLGKRQRQTEKEELKAASSKSNPQRGEPPANNTIEPTR